jgi:hypothetical protein
MRTSIRSLSNANPSCWKRAVGAAVTATVFTLGALTPSVARADETSVSPTGKGIIGGALLGAEVGTIVESIAGVHNPWIYVITDVVLGAGGAVGGWEVEQHSSDGRAPVFLLAGGLGLIIPAVVLTLNGTKYQEAENATEDHAPTNGPVANPGTPGGSIVSPSPAAPAPSSAPPPAPGPAPASPPSGTTPHLSLFDVNGQGFHLGVPVPEVRPLFSASELRQYGLTQQTEVRMPLVKIAF